MWDRRPDRSCSLWRSWEFPILGSLGPVQSQSFFSLETGLLSTTYSSVSLIVIVQCVYWPIKLYYLCSSIWLWDFIKNYWLNMCATYQIKLQGCSGSVADHLNDFYQTRSQKILRPPADPPQPYIRDPRSATPLVAAHTSCPSHHLLLVSHESWGRTHFLQNTVPNIMHMLFQSYKYFLFILWNLLGG